MGLFDSIGKRQTQPAAPQGPPVDQVAQMQQKGMTNNQIVEALQRSGYDINTIMDAIAQAEAVGGVQQMPQGMAPGPAPLEQEQYPMGNMPLPPRPMGDYGGGNIEEVAERVVEERWQEFQKELSKWGEWRDNVNLHIERLEQAATDMRNDLDNLHKAIVGKIGEYDKNLIDVGTEIKAMEKVFQKVLPTLTENVSELGRITRNIKGPK